MGVVSVKELPRTFEREVAGNAVITRHWVCVMSDDTLSAPPLMADVTAATGTGTFGVYHPDPLLAGWRLRKVSVREGYEGSPYHVEVIGEYGIIRPDELLAPVDRPQRISYSSGAGEVPALYYYEGDTAYPLTNSAYDYFPGLVTQEALMKVTVQKNFAAPPTSWLAATNHVNSGAWNGLATHTVRVDGVEAQITYEEYGGAVVAYYDSTATLTYRQSGHSLQLPDIGFNFLAGGQKRRAMVFDFENSEWVASPNPVGLNGSGGQTGGAPAILVRRVNPQTDFTALFPIS